MDLPRRAGEPGADDGAPYCSELYSVLSVQVSTLENLSLFERDCLAAWLVARDRRERETVESKLELVSSKLERVGRLYCVQCSSVFCVVGAGEGGRRDS